MNIFFQFPAIVSTGIIAFDNRSNYTQSLYFFSNPPFYSGGVSTGTCVCVFIRSVDITWTHETKKKKKKLPGTQFQTDSWIELGLASSDFHSISVFGEGSKQSTHRHLSLSYRKTRDLCAHPPCVIVYVRRATPQLLVIRKTKTTRYIYTESLNENSHSISSSRFFWGFDLFISSRFLFPFGWSPGMSGDALLEKYSRDEVKLLCSSSRKENTLIYHVEKKIICKKKSIDRTRKE